MAQNTKGIFSVLSRSTSYRLVQTALGFLAARRRIIEQYVKPHGCDRILDIGCGPGDVVRFLPDDVRYIGFDQSAAYIRAARKRFGHRATFQCERIQEKTLDVQQSFDIALALGVLHHLDDRDVRDLFRLAYQALKPGGRLVTLDGCYLPGQSRVARWLLVNDRGQNVRTEQHYLKLADTVFSNVSSAIRHDMFWFPYTALILQCQR